MLVYREEPSQSRSWMMDMSPISSTTPSDDRVWISLRVRPGSVIVMFTPTLIVLDGAEPQRPKESIYHNRTAIVLAGEARLLNHYNFMEILVKD